MLPTLGAASLHAFHTSERPAGAQRSAARRQMAKYSASFREESALWRRGLRLVAGLDEVGRGALAGPVAAGVVVFAPSARFPWLRYVQDSKALSPRQREELAAHIRAKALAWGVGFVSHSVIDELGIARATRLAMMAALAEMSLEPEFLLLDAFPLPEAALPQRPIIGGDALSRSIAAASIIAKVARDELMRGEDVSHAGYGFASNKGYATPRHLRALGELGPCAIHRRSFSPLRQAALPLEYV